MYGAGTVKQKDFLSPLEINQFEVFFCINVIQKVLHNLFQSNASYPELSGVIPALFLMLLGFFCLVFLYWPCRQPPWSITHPGDLLSGTTPASMGSPTRSPQVLVTPGVMQSPTPSPEHLGWEQTPQWGAGTWVMGEQQQDIPLLLPIVTEIWLMFQVSNGTSVGKLLFIQGMILIAKTSPCLASTEFKGTPV